MKATHTRLSGKTRVAAFVPALIAALWGAAAAQGLQPVKVTLDFGQETTVAREALDGSGSVVIDGGVRIRGGLGGFSTTTRTTRSSGVFTLVQDGGTSSLSLETRVPYEEVTFYRDYVTGAGYVSSGVVFERVGTAMRVGVRILEGDRILVQLTPTISWLSSDGSGAIDVTEASTELVVRDGEPVTIGGGTRELHALTRRILGVGRESEESETALTLTATISR